MNDRIVIVACVTSEPLGLACHARYASSTRTHATLPLASSEGDGLGTAGRGAGALALVGDSPHPAMSGTAQQLRPRGRGRLVSAALHPHSRPRHGTRRAILL